MLISLQFTGPVNNYVCFQAFGIKDVGEDSKLAIKKVLAEVGSSPWNTVPQQCKI